jgi:hypothetical protein
MRGVQLTIGARVHYRSHGSPILASGKQVHAPKCRPADVVEIIAGEFVTLHVINPSGIFFDDCRHDENRYPDVPPGAGGTWHWPCEQLHG